MKMPLPMRRWEDQPPAAPKRRMRRGMYILPSLFTALNIGAAAPRNGATGRPAT